MLLIRLGNYNDIEKHLSGHIAEKEDYQTILFDLDGTIIDSVDGIVRSVNHALTAFGMGVKDLSSLKNLLVRLSWIL